MKRLGSRRNLNKRSRPGPASGAKGQEDVGGAAGMKVAIV